MASAPIHRWRRAVLAADLATPKKAVALALSVYVNRQGEGRPSRAELADAASVSVRTVQRAIVDLERLGLVDVTRYRGRSRTNLYRLVPPPEKRDTPVPFSEVRALWNSLGITPKNETGATIKGDPRVSRN